MAQHSLKQRIQKDKLLQHSYYCIEEPMQSGGEAGRENRDFNTWIRTNKDMGPALFQTANFCMKLHRQMIFKNVIAGERRRMQGQESRCINYEFQNTAALAVFH